MKANTMEQFLTQLIEIPSVSSDLEQLKAVADFVEGYLKQNDIQVERFEKNGKPSLVAYTQQPQDKKFRVILNGHLDVVPAAAGEFTVRVDGKKMYGRGTSDMKGVDAGMIDVFIKFAKRNGAEGIGLMLTCDEEVGGFNGVDYLLNECGYSADVAFIPDGGDNWTICTDEKAVLFVKVSAQGVSAHGSRPWQGENAVEKLMNAYQGIKEVFESRWGLPTADNYWLPTINLGKIQGGDATNKVAESAEMNVDVRFPASVAKDEIVQIFKDICKQNGVEFAEILFGAANHTEEDNKFICTWKEIIEKAGHKTKFWKACGGSDGRFFSDKDIPVVMSKPICSEPHIEGEWIDLESLKEWCEHLEEWLESI